MSRKGHPLKVITTISTRLIRRFLKNTKRQIIWLLRAVFRSQRQQNTANAGFILPTVAMISIVVVLLTTAIMLRSFERAKNASNVRVNQGVLNAATPAIDRGRAKINQLFADTSLPRATPTDDALYTLLVSKITSYTFGDETPLQLGFDFTDSSGGTSSNGKIDLPNNNTAIYNNETLNTAWSFPVDTDNNGKFDSYTLYSILFRTPKVSSGGKYERSRNPLEARTPPMASGTVDANCGIATSASLVGNTGWVRQDNELKKSFFVYTATVPITTPPTDTNYEKYKGNTGFAAVEYQQDRIQIPPNNKAVVYEDDISLTPGAAFNLNGGIFTNSNLLTSNLNGGSIKLYQVSSPSSCYYEAKNAKITVGGNTALGNFTVSSHSGSATVDLYKGKGSSVATSSWVQSATNSPRDMSYNNLAYANRIKSLVTAQMTNASSTDPQTVKDGIEKKKIALGLSSFTPAEFDKYRSQQLTLWFKARTRRVPYTEVAFGATDTAPTPLLQGSGDTLRANDKWIYPTDPTDGKTGTNYAKLTLNLSTTSLEPKATEPEELKDNSGNEGFVGDRVMVGNNLPEIWWDQTKNKFVGPGILDTQSISGIKWDGTKKTDRTRRSLVQALADVGSTDRDGDWELDAAKVPKDITEPVGGLRVITGTGIYLTADQTPSSSFPNTPTDFIWPDSNPVPLKPITSCADPLPPDISYNNNGTKICDPTNFPNNNTYIPDSYDQNTISIRPYSLYEPDIKYTWSSPTATQPYLQMRATAVYHYKSTNYNAQTPKPIACVSSFYVPTSRTTAKNQDSLPNAANTLPNNTPRILKDPNGLSNNGIVYPAPTKTETDYSAVLAYQAKLTYRNGRSIDDGLLARALAKTASTRTISEQSAIDAQICALQIKYDSTFTPVTSIPVIDHGAISEIAFLDSREVQQNSISGTSQTYDMPVKDRQPLEIRATVLDLHLLRTKTVGGSSPTQEYLLPNSGIIYATRDDALPDMSADTAAGNFMPTEDNKSLSPVDYVLDPKRRPGGIMLVNGSKLWRTTAYRDEEKGLILATNLPVYIKDDFNLHTKEEFTTALTDNWSNFYSRTTLDPNFACRPGDPRLPNCTTGDEWRPATVLADTITLLSGAFREGFRDEGEYDWNYSVRTTPTTTTSIISIPSLSTPNFLGAMGTWAYNTETNAGYPKDFVQDVLGQPDTIGYQNSSYVNNFVSPLIRMIPAKEYAYEVCYYADASQCFCTATDTAAQCATKTRNWVVTNVAHNGYQVNNPNGQSNWRGDINAAINAIEMKTGFVGNDSNKTSDWQALPFRRIAVVRDLTTTLPITPLSFYGKPSSGNKMAEYPVGGTTQPPIASGVLIPWFQRNTSTNLLEPVLQIQRPFATEADPTNNSFVASGSDNKNWLRNVDADTTFNLIFAVGDSPGRSNGNNSEDNGGLHNFPRFMENWSPSSGQKKARINGSFMQVKKSAYATGPFATALSNTINLLYSINLTGAAGTNGTASGYLPPVRQWGYDVALLSQSPDQFASKLVLTPPDLPDEYFREVGRDDRWVQTLLCARTADDTTKFAIDADQRPSCTPYQ